MINQLKSRLTEAEATLRRSFGNDISTPAGRRSAVLHFHLMDHAYLRVFWTNLAQIAPGVWRSNQPSPRRIARYSRMGISNIITLRGDKPKSHHLLEAEACDTHGINLHAVSLSARKLVAPKHLLALLDLFDTLEKPFLMHCKSGADRAGLASALYLLHAQGAAPETAAKQLSIRFLHLRNDSTGILDYMLDAYFKEMSQAPITVRSWIETRYNPEQLTAEFKATRGTA